VIQGWADSVLRGTLVEKTISLLRSFGDQVMLRSPAEFDILRLSTSLRLTDDGDPVFDLPALMPRFSDAELKTIRAAAGGSPQLRALGRLR
jgi:hypothetical protein